MSLREYIKDTLPGPVVDRARRIRDVLRVTMFSPKTATHMFGDVRLTLRIADPVGQKWYDKEWAELPEITFLKKRKLKPGARVFDIGAHQAVIATWLAKIVGENGSVVALEPGHFNFTVGVENRALNAAQNLTLLNAAVADHNGEISFLGCLNGKISRSGSTVKCFTIDDLSNAFGEPDIVFIDIEGFEWLALQNGSSTLRGSADWFVEVHGGCGLETFGGSAEGIVNLFRSFGYSLFCQSDPHYRYPFAPLTTIPGGRFFLIATKTSPTMRGTKL